MTPTYSAEILYAPTVATADYYPIQLQGINQQTDGSFLLQFPSVPGHWYRIKYSTDLINWYNAQVPVLATDVSTSWADGGPPSTDTHPAATTARFYKANDITP